MSSYKNISLLIAVLVSSLLGAANTGSPVLKITKDTYAKTIEQSNKPVIIDIFAEWCGPCKTMTPVFQQFAEQHKALYTCAQLNYDEATELAQSLGVASLPSCVVVHKKKVLGKVVGSMSAEALKSKVDELISTAGKSLKELTKEQLATHFEDALQACDVAQVTKIIEAGADVNATLPNGFTPFSFMIVNCARSGDKGVKMLQLLLDKGASTKEFKMPGVSQGQMTVEEFVTSMLTNAHRMIEAYTPVLALLEAKPAKKA